MIWLLQCAIVETSDFWGSIVGMKPSYEKLIGRMLGALEVVLRRSRLQSNLFFRLETRFFLYGPWRYRRKCRRGKPQIA